jgi:anti-sigma factor RsiW
MSFWHHKSEHEYVDESLSAYLDGELTLRERTRVEQHLKECQACAENLRTLRQTVALLKELPAVPAPRSFAVRPRVAKTRPAPAPSAWGYGLLKGATAISALLFVLLIGGDLALHVVGGPLASFAPAAPAPEAAPAPSHQADMGLAPSEEAPVLGQEKETAELEATPPENAQAIAPTAPAEPHAEYAAGATPTPAPGIGGGPPAETLTAGATPEPPSGAGAVEGTEIPTPVPTEPTPTAAAGEVSESATPPPAATSAEEGEQRAVAPGPEETPQVVALAQEAQEQAPQQVSPPPTGGAGALSLLRLAELVILGLLVVLVPATALSAWWTHRAR